MCLFINRKNDKTNFYSLQTSNRRGSLTYIGNQRNIRESTPPLKPFCCCFNGTKLHFFSILLIIKLDFYHCSL